MQINEGSGIALTGRVQTVDAQLAAVDDAMRHGEMERVAALLQDLAPYIKGHRAATAFSSAVETRALLEQNAVLLRAHAAALACAHWQQ
jgi:hypothetical protein